MPGVAREHITEDGLLVQHLSDGSTIRKCLTESCIRNHVEKNGKQKCDCPDCASERLAKAAGSTDGYELSTLREKLPEELFEAVVEHLDLDEGPPESMDEVGKSLAEELYDDGVIEKQDGLTPSHHLGDPFEKDASAVKASGSHESMGLLDHFYDGVEGQ